MFFFCAYGTSFHFFLIPEEDYHILPITELEKRKIFLNDDNLFTFSFHSKDYLFYLDEPNC